MDRNRFRYDFVLFGRSSLAGRFSFFISTVRWQSIFYMVKLFFLWCFFSWFFFLWCFFSWFFFLWCFFSWFFFLWCFFSWFFFLWCFFSWFFFLWCFFSWFLSIGASFSSTLSSIAGSFTLSSTFLVSSFQELLLILFLHHIEKQEHNLHQFYSF